MTSAQTAYEPRIRNTPFPLMQVGTVFRKVSEKVDPHLYEPLSVGQLGVTPQLEGVAQQQGDGEKKLVRPGQIAMNSRSDRRGASGLSEFEGVVSVVYTVLQPDLNYVYPRFAHYLFRSLDFQNEYYRWGTGIVDDLWSTKFERLAQIRIPLPPLETQRRIAEYLDKEISEMDALIEEFEELVKNLELKRSLEINQVFKKLEPRLPIGYVVNTKTNGTMINGETIPAEGEEFGVLKTSAVSTGAFKPTQNKKILPEEQHLATVPVTGGTLLINRLNSPDYVGSCAYVESDFPTLFVSDKIWKLDLTINNRFFHYWTFTHDYRHQVREAIVGTSSSMQSLSYNAFLRYKMPVPDEETQNSVVSDLDRTFERMNALIEESTRLIENLKARKTALITEVVTGRKEV